MSLICLRAAGVASKVFENSLQIGAAIGRFLECTERDLLAEALETPASWDPRDLPLRFIHSVCLKTWVDNVSFDHAIVHDDRLLTSTASKHID